MLKFSMLFFYPLRFLPLLLRVMQNLQNFCQAFDKSENLREDVIRNNFLIQEVIFTGEALISP